MHTHQLNALSFILDDKHIELEWLIITKRINVNSPINLKELLATFPDLFNHFVDGADTPEMRLQKAIYNSMVIAKEMLFINFTVLHKSVLCLQSLLKHGARMINTSGTHLPTIACGLVWYPGTPATKTIIQILLKAGANPNAESTQCGTPLHLAVRVRGANCTEIVKLLLKHEANPNIVNAAGVKPHDILLAKNRADTDLLLLLIGKGATFEHTFKCGTYIDWKTRTLVSKQSTSIQELLIEPIAFIRKVLPLINCAILNGDHIQKIIKKTIHESHVDSHPKTGKKRIIWLKNKLSSLENFLTHNVGKMYSGKLPSLENLCEYRVKKLPGLLAVIHRYFAQEIWEISRENLMDTQSHKPLSLKRMCLTTIYNSNQIKDNISSTDMENLSKITCSCLS